MPPDQDASVEHDSSDAVTREALYEEVWSEPMIKVAARYKVSSSYLARICGQLNVPRPQRGYWAKLAVGIESKRPPLPEARPGDLMEWRRDGSEQRVLLPRPKAPEVMPRRRRRLATDGSSRHQLIEGAQQLFEAGRESDEGYLKPAKKLLPDFIVTKGTLGRALDLGNELFMLLEDWGHQVALAPGNGHLHRHAFDEREKGGRDRHYSTLWSPMRSTVVFVGTVAIGITVFEMSEEVEVRWQDGKYVRAADTEGRRRGRSVSNNPWIHKHDLPSGRLCLQAYSPYPGTEWAQQWREAKAGDLAGKISAIARTLESEATTIAHLAEVAEQQAAIERRQWEEQCQRWQAKEAERRRAEAAKASREELLAAIENWAEAKRIEAFFKEVEAQMVELDEDNRAAVRERLQRARMFIGDVDALKRFLEWKAPVER
jgi:hypothetical protein